MKKTIIALASLTLILTAFKTNTMVTEKKKSTTSSEQMAEQVVTALQQSSSKAYVALFPSLSDFTQFMHESSEIYGSNLREAQREFSSNYENKLIPAVLHSFEALVEEGKQKGIDWRTIRYVGIELEEQPHHYFTPVPVNIVISSHGVEHRIHIQKALVINGQWKVSQYVKFI